MKNTRRVYHTSGFKAVRAANSDSFIIWQRATPSLPRGAVYSAVYSAGGDVARVLERFFISGKIFAFEVQEFDLERVLNEARAIVREEIT